MLHIFANRTFNTYEAMKIITLITGSLLLAINCYAQITTIEEKEKPIEVQKYDSLESLRIENAPQHVGQTLFLKGTEHAKKNDFFMIFFTKKIGKRERGLPYTYKPISGKKEGEIVSSYADLVGKYYKVLSVETNDRNSYETSYWLQLLGNDSIPFYYNMTEGLNDFVTLGYYKKMKKTFVGEEFYSQISYEREKADSKETVSIPTNTRFKCTDIAVKIGTDEPIFAVSKMKSMEKLKEIL